MTNIGPPVHFVDNPHAPDVFATEAAGFWIYNGNVVITFATARINHSTTPGPVNRVVIGRLVMTAPDAQNFAVQLFDFLKKQGFDPTKQDGAPPMQ